jgi:hypothetical protein
MRVHRKRMTTEMAIAMAGSTHHAAGRKRTITEETMAPALLMTSLMWSSASAFMASDRDASHLLRGRRGGVWGCC